MSSYIAANNDREYSEYEQKLYRILKEHPLNFLSPETNVGIFTVEEYEGQSYCQQISEEFPEIVPFLQENQQLKRFMEVGQQKKFYSRHLLTEITPNASRYIYHALLIHKYIKEKYNGKTIDIVEIGGGYGGLSYWLQLIVNTIHSYTIVDLPAACQLQKSCLSHLGATKSTSITDPYKVNPSNPLFVISNYGYSEFNAHYQNLYKNTVLKKADAGFMIWNNWTGLPFFTDLPMRVEPERPVFPNVPNKFIYF
jgi:hypothetical protein